MQKRQVCFLEIAALERDEVLQSRVQIDTRVVKEYADLMVAGAIFPPVLVYSDGSKSWLADGYHRTAARALLMHASVLAEIRQGSLDDAVWAGCAANQAHGLRRSNEDKRRAVERALLHPRARRLSDRQLALHCGVHHETVGTLRRSLQRTGIIEPVAERAVVRGQSHYTQRVAGITEANRRRGAPTEEEHCVYDVPSAYEAGSVCDQPAQTSELPAAMQISRTPADSDHVDETSPPPNARPGERERGRGAERKTEGPAEVRGAFERVGTALAEASEGFRRASAELATLLPRSSHLPPPDRRRLAEIQQQIVQFSRQVSALSACWTTIGIQDDSHNVH